MTALAPAITEPKRSRRPNWRAEFRLLLLAAAESCWIYALLLTLGGLSGLAHEVGYVGVVLVFWVGLMTGRILPRQKQTWRILQFVTIAIAVVVIFAAMRLAFYDDLSLFDLSWVTNYPSRVLSLFERVTPEELSTIALVFAFVRGLGFAQRALTLWTVGFEFRLGIVIFFGAAVLASFAPNINFRPWIFVYFAVSLLGISLARIEEAGQERPLGYKWALVLGGALLAMSLLGLAVTQLLTLDVVNAVFDFLSPVRFLVAGILTILALPFLYLLELLLNLIAPILTMLMQRLSQLLPNLDFARLNSLETVNQISHQLELAVPYLRLVGIVLVAVLVGWLIARALNKRMNWEEREQFTREALGERDRAEVESGKRPRAARPTPREIHAENVRRIYAALQAQAEAFGLKRNRAETPLEFLPRLSDYFPGNANEFRTITEAYVAVHYAQKPATDDQVRELRRVWQGLREQMQAQGRRMKQDRKATS